MRTPPSRLLVRTVAVLALVLSAMDVGAQSAPGSAGAKLASKCQQTISKANGKFVGQRLKQLAACSNAVLGCVQTAPGDAKCLAKAGAKCDKQLGAPNAAGDKLEAAIVKKCGAVPVIDLLSADVLGFGNAAARCADLGVTLLTNVTDVAHCLRLLHAQTSEASYGVELPRAGDLAGRGGVDAASIPDLPLFGGCGDCNVGAPATGKAVTACAAAINKAAAGFIASTRTALDKCSAAFVKCAQEKPGDAGCVQKAAATCAKVPDGLAKSRAKLQAGIAKKCAGAAPFATLASDSGIDLGALGCACQQVGVDAVLDLDDYATCVGRHHECALAALVPTVVPGLDGLLAAQGIALSDLLCEPATATALEARAGGRAFTPPFGTISKYMKNVFPAQLTQAKSPVATRGTTPRVGASTAGKCTPAPGKSCTFRFPITKKPTTLKQGARGVVEPPKMIVAVRRLDGEFVDDFYEMPLADTTNDSEVELQVDYADDLASCDFELAVTVQEDGEVATYTPIPQEPHLPPTNDVCGEAKAVTENPFFDTVDTTAAGFEADATPICTEGISRGVWYSFVPDTTGTLLVSTAGSDFRAAIDVFANGCTGTGTEVGCAGSPFGDETLPATLQMPVVAGTPYRIHIASLSDFETPTSTLHLSIVFVPAPIGQSATISQLVLGTPTLNTAECSFTDPPGSSFPITVTYSDPSGNVQDGQVAPLVLEHFEPSQREEVGIYTAPPFLIGDANNGTATVNVCALFNADTIISFKVRLVTIGGVSNELVGALPKPPGAD